MSRIRIKRMESELEKLFNTILSFEIRNSDLDWVSITRISLSPDFKYAKVYFSSLSHDADTSKILKALNRTKGFFKNKIAQAKMMRIIPEITFLYDETEKKASELDDIFAKIHEEKSE